MRLCAINPQPAPGAEMSGAYQSTSAKAPEADWFARMNVVARYYAD
jgi:hypothetical protein